MKKTLLSVVIPVYNEEKNLPILHSKLCGVFEGLSGFQYEVLLVNDGSRDASWQVIQELSSQDERFIGISLSRNFGQQAALEAGLASATGDVIIMMDADLEQPPSLIPTLLEKWQEGFMVVNTTRESNQAGRSWFKRLTSKWFYRVFNALSDVEIQSASCDFHLLDRRVLSEMLKVNEGSRFFSGLVAWTGFPTTVVKYDDGVRINGTPGYSLSKLFDLASTAITSFSSIPLKLILFVGLFIFVISTLLIFAMAIVNFFTGYKHFSDLAFLVVFIIINNGLILSVLGVISQYLLCIHKTVQNKPNFIISDVTRLKAKI
jgi:dolichol-phosphate mannosyltransferase